MKYNIYAYLDQEGFYTDEFASQEEADEATWQAAIECYESYAGINGIPEYADIEEEYLMDRDSIGITAEDEDAIWDTYCEEISSWIHYYAIPTDQDKNKEEE